MHRIFVTFLVSKVTGWLNEVARANMYMLSDIELDDEDEDVEEGLDMLSDIELDDEDDDIDESYNYCYDDIDRLEDEYLGREIRILRMDDPYGERYAGKIGKVTRVELVPGDVPGTRDVQLHGTWGGCAVIPSIDEFEFV